MVDPRTETMNAKSYTNPGGLDKNLFARVPPTKGSQYSRTIMHVASKLVRSFVRHRGDTFDGIMLPHYQFDCGQSTSH